MLTCKETSKLISAQYDRRLGWGERLAMRRHFLMCRHCRTAAGHIALIQELAGSRQEADMFVSANSSLSLAARERILNTLAGAASADKTDIP